MSTALTAAANGATRAINQLNLLVNLAAKVFAAGRLSGSTNQSLAAKITRLSVASLSVNVHRRNCGARRQAAPSGPAAQKRTLLLRSRGPRPTRALRDE